MAKQDKQGRQYARLADLAVGQSVWLDGGFTCAMPGNVELFAVPDGRLYFPCGEGYHFVDGQADGRGNCIGIFTSDPGPMKWEHGGAPLKRQGGDQRR